MEDRMIYMELMNTTCCHKHGCSQTIFFYNVLNRMEFTIIFLHCMYYILRALESVRVIPNPKLRPSD